MALSATSPERGRNALISGRYRILAELGRGGMAAVVRAFDETTGRTLALKQLESADPRVLALFEREYYTLASLKHPRVIEVYDFGIEARGRRFYTMELLDGDDLSAIAPLPPAAAAAHLRDIATSLALLHARRLVHRDVSPRNIRLDAAGRAKLIDFGALASFGAVREIVGTPPFMAPEAPQRGELDQRSDLFSLGAVAYHLLTKRLPFELRTLEEMAEAHRVAPPPPSAFAPDVPPALDELVLSLLSIDPLGRPSSAAEVIDRLSAIAQLDAEPLTGVAESHLLSSALVGRERERALLRQHLAHAERGAGNVVVIDGVPGMGRTRLGNELLVHARIAGVTALRVDAPASTSPNATLRAICLALSEAAPGEAARAFATHGAELGQAFPELAARFAVSAPARPWAAAASERRARVQSAFAAWVLAVAEQRPLVLLIDDAHALDADSAGALVLLGHALSGAKLLLALTLPREVTLPAAVQQLTRIAARVRLSALRPEQVAGLVASVFGDVPHRARVAQWLEQTARGNPGHALELLRHLVGRGVIRYERGSWSLPSELPEQELPRGVEEALRARVKELGPTARRLSQLLALYRAALPLRVCLELLPTRAAAEIVTALDALVARDVAVRSEDSYRFSQDALRAAVLADNTLEQTQALHRQLAHALRRAHQAAFDAVLASRADGLATAELNMVLEVATHFELCGEPDYGRHLLREAAVELTMRGDGLPDAVPALEAAVARLKREGRSKYEAAPLLVPLALAGTYSDFRLSYRYGEEALELLIELTGIALAQRLRRWLGPRLALGCGLAFALARHPFLVRTMIGTSFRDLILGVIGIASALLGTYSVLLDEARARRVIERTDMLRYFPRGHAVSLVRTLHLALYDAARGDSAGSSGKAMSVLEAVSRLRGVRDEARLQLSVGCLTPSSLGYSQRVDGRIDRVFAALDRLQVSVSRQIAAGARAVYHGHRGERAKFVQFHEEMDMLASRAGSTWREDVGTPRQMWSTYVLCEDVMGLRRCAQELDGPVAEAPSLANVRDAARACYLAERGMHDQALARYEAMFEQQAAAGGLMGTRFAGAYARILRAAGRHQRAVEVCERALGLIDAEERGFTLAVFGAELERALGHAALGHSERALGLLDEVRVAQGEHDNPLVHGLHHKARAQIALLRGDGPSLVEQLAAMEHWFRRTDNPALIAQHQRLTKQARAAGLLASDAGQAEISPAALELPEIAAAFRGCRGPAERLQVALELILERTAAERGYLYLLEPGGLRCVAPAVGAEPPELLRDQLAALVEPLQRARHDLAPQLPARGLAPTTLASLRAAESRADGASDPPPPSDWVLLPLKVGQAGDVRALGAVALVPGAVQLTPADPTVLEAIARALLQADDVRSVYLAARPPREPDAPRGDLEEAPESLRTLRARPLPSNENGSSC